MGDLPLCVIMILGTLRQSGLIMYVMMLLLQPLTGENVIPATANRQDDARADIHARGFWGCQQSAFFDVRVFIPMHEVTATPVSLLCIDAMR